MNNIIRSDISYEMKNRYIDYAMSVIIGRALPDVRDGLKPVHRRILYAMHELGLSPEKSYRKCARIVGDVLGKYHPHGDTAVYDALVRMAQDFSIRYTLVDGHGNFGSVDGDSPAQMRYTEARMQKITLEMLRDINKNTVDFIPNFDGEEKEPSVLPSRFPNLLVNGSEGIAVGMATKIPPHNLTEVINGILYLIDNKDCIIKELLNYITAPDFPTKATIINPQNMLKVYSEGKGQIVMRAKYHMEEDEKYKQIIFTEIPYQSNKSKICNNIVNKVLTKEPVLKLINDVRDESDREGMRIVVELKKSIDENKILAKLFKNSNFQLQVNYNSIFLAIVNNEPKVLNLKQILQYYIEHQKEVITRRTQFDLDKSQKRLHILEGLKKAISNIDKSIKLIRNSKNNSEAKEKLIEYLSIDEIQAKSILDLKLQRLTGLEIETIDIEYNDLLKKITQFKLILNNKHKLLEVLKSELIEIKDKYGDERRTQLIYEDDIQPISSTDLIEDYNCKIIYTKSGYIKKLNKSISFDQHKLKDNDTILSEISSTNKSTLFLFTNKANRYKLYSYELPICSSPTKSYGEYLPNTLSSYKLEKDEKVIRVISIDESNPNGYIISIFENGKIAKVNLKSFISSNRKLQNCYSTESKLLDIDYIDKDIDVFMISNEGKSLIVNTSQITKPKATKNTQGNQAMNIKSKEFENSKVIGCVINPKQDGYFKLTTKKDKVLEFYLDNVAPTNKENEQRSLYNYISGRFNNGGNFLVNCRAKKDEVISLSTTQSS